MAGSGSVAPCSMENLANSIGRVIIQGRPAAFHIPVQPQVFMTMGVIQQPGLRGRYSNREQNHARNQIVQVLENRVLRE